MEIKYAFERIEDELMQLLLKARRTKYEEINYTVERFKVQFDLRILNIRQMLVTDTETKEEKKKLTIEELREVCPLNKRDKNIRMSPIDIMYACRDCKYECDFGRQFKG